VTLLDFVRLTRANVWMILVLVLTGAAAASVITARIPHVYQADASGYVLVAGQAESTGEGIAATSLDPRISAAALCAMVEGFARHWMDGGDEVTEDLSPDPRALRTLTELWARALGLIEPGGG